MDEFVLNNPTQQYGVETLHTRDGSEQCNRDEMGGNRTRIDEATARSLVERGQARRCEHCRPLA